MSTGTSQAFPVPGVYGQYGMTKRELFAAMAMQGILADHTTETVPAATIAAWSVECADALLAELAKGDA